MDLSRVVVNEVGGDDENEETTQAESFDLLPAGDAAATNGVQIESVRSYDPSKMLLAIAERGGFVRIARSEENVRGGHVQDRDSRTPLFSGLYLDVSRIPDERFEDRLLCLRDALRALENPDCTQPVLALDIMPFRTMKLKYLASQFDYESYTGEEWTDPDPSNERPDGAVLLMSAEEIANVEHIIPQGGLGFEGGSKSMMKVNAELQPIHWFRAANLLMAEKRMPMRLVPFPCVQNINEYGEEEDNEYSADVLTYRGILATPEEYDQWATITHKFFEQHGVVDGFATGSRYGYVVMHRRIVEGWEIKCHKIQKYNERLAREQELYDQQYARKVVECNGDEEAIAKLTKMDLGKPKELPPQPDIEKNGITPRDVDMWTTGFILMKDSKIHGVVVNKEVIDGDLVDQVELASRFQIFR